MIDKYYTYKDIVLGSRLEYLKIQDYLKELKELITISHKEIIDFNFELMCQYLNNQIGIANRPKLICRYVQDLKTIKGIITYLKLQGNLYNYNSEIGKIVNDNGNYIISSKYNNGVIENHDKFNFLVETILKSDFVNKMNFIIDFKTNDEDKSTIEQTLILPNYIKYAAMSGKDYYSLYYEVKNDILSFESSMIMNKKQLVEYLYQPINLSILSNYHKNLIINSSSINKEIDIQGEFDTNSLSFNIEESKDKIILCKQKTLKRNKYTNVVR